jgi:hypothetical protein
VTTFPSQEGTPCTTLHHTVYTKRKHFLFIYVAYEDKVFFVLPGLREVSGMIGSYNSLKKTNCLDIYRWAPLVFFYNMLKKLSNQKIMTL